MRSTLITSGDSGVPEEDVTWRESGRGYSVSIDLASTTNVFSDDALEVLKRTMQSSMEPADLTLKRTSDPYAIMTIKMTTRATRPLAALTKVDTSLDVALFSAGLFEEFDVTGKVLHVGPARLVGSRPPRAVSS